MKKLGFMYLDDGNQDGELVIVDTMTGEVISVESMGKERWCGASLAEWAELYENAIGEEN